MRVALIYPPLLDPTAGYHSLSYLRSYAVDRCDDDIRVIDASVEAVNHLLDPAVSRALLAERHDRRQALLARATTLTPREVAELGQLTKLDGCDVEELQTAVRVLRDERTFYDYPTYRWAVERLIQWMSVAGSQGLPGQFRHGFRLHWEGWSPSRVDDLTDLDLLETLNRPFRDYYETVLLPELDRLAPQVIGLNLTFVSQTPFALWLLRLLRARFPEAHLTCGGTELSDIWKYLQDKGRFFEVFDAADTCVVGEGESEFVSILSAVRHGDHGRLGGATLLHPRHGGPVVPTPRYRYEKLGNIGTPDMSHLPFDLYLAPHRYLYYSPSRGCYWNRCTFCDYGLNEDSPTSPWRQDPAEKVVRDLAAISRVARYVYLSVDVLAPAMLLRVAEHLVRHGVDVRWGAELRLEKYWSPEKCRTLRDSGCVALSVGFESGNQRVLDLIDKGTRTERVEVVIGHMAAAGIPIQMMGFTGFPTESFDEAMDSVRFLQEHRDLWTLGGLGEFTLTSGAIVAREPDRFGVRDIRPARGTDIARALDYDHDVRPDDHEQAALRREKQTLRTSAFGRPWLGGIDTPHSYFYHDRYGRDVVRILRMALWQRARDWKGRWQLNGRMVTTPPGYVYADGPDDESRLIPAADADSTSTVFVRADGRVYALDESTQVFLSTFTQPAHVSAVTECHSTVNAEQVHRLWVSAVFNHLLVPEGEPSRIAEALLTSSRT